MTYQPTQSFRSRRQQSWSRNQNNTAFTSTIKLGPVAHTVLVGLMVTVLGLIYLTQATRATGYDYATQKIDHQIAELSTQKDDLEIENARLSALESIRNSDVAAGMVEPSDVQYIR